MIKRWKKGVLQKDMAKRLNLAVSTINDNLNKRYLCSKKILNKDEMNILGEYIERNRTVSAAKLSKEIENLFNNKFQAQQQKDMPNT